MKVAVLVSGGGTNLEAIFQYLENNKVENVEIVKVISNKPQAYALERAKNHGVEGQCISPKDYETREQFDQALLDALVASEAELVVLAGYLVILPVNVIRHFENHIINIHPSLIPSFCGPGFYGLKVHEAVLARGCKVTGATVHFVDDGTDTGPIITQKAVYVEEGDTPEVLQRRVMEQAEWQILPKTIVRIAEGKVKVVNGRVVQE